MKDRLLVNLWNKKIKVYIRPNQAWFAHILNSLIVAGNEKTFNIEIIFILKF